MLSTMNPQKRQLFVVLVHYGEPSVTHEALQAIGASHYLPAKVIVIDHAATPLVLPDGLAAQVLRPATNSGYGAGMNSGLGALLHSAQASDVVVMMNNDVVVYPDTFQTLVAWWDRHTTVGVAGVQIEEGQAIVWGGGRVNIWTGRAILSHQASAQLAYIHGAFIAATYRAWLDIKGWPEQPFLYWEDVTVGYRWRRRGWQLALARAVRVRHNQHSSKRSPQQVYYLVRNGAVFLEEELPMVGRWWWRVVNQARYVYHRLQKRPPHPLIAQALRDARQRKLGQRTP